MRTKLLLLALLLVPGCAGVRFTMDFVPDDESLRETVVLEDETDEWAPPAPKIALIEVSGLIADARTQKLLGSGPNPVAQLVESLEKAERDERVYAVLLRINSPGGTVTASDVMHREVMRFKERSRKPVVVLMADVAASGGYYLACAGDEIVAHPTTVTGSIGVIMQIINVSDGMRRIGIRSDAITSGPNKTMGSPFEPMSVEHRALLQGVVDEMYAEFLARVHQGRPNIPEDELKALADGRVFTGRTALQLGLVDAVGDVHDAFELAKARCHLDRARLVRYHRAGARVGTVYGRTPVAEDPALLELRVNAPEMTGPMFMYLWDGGS